MTHLTRFEGAGRSLFGLGRGVAEEGREVDLAERRDNLQRHVHVPREIEAWREFPALTRERGVQEPREVRCAHRDIRAVGAIPPRNSPGGVGDIPPRNSPGGVGAIRGVGAISARSSPGGLGRRREHDHLQPEVFERHPHLLCEGGFVGG
eukprot:CAMPEP_0180409654 /NCGR_PEP_ID=MMETSP0989-20121125/42965_2 /TAXON_ID=697907 /ORGANISM="non described non described, Strain CCMP2293" /LENGTH=149 /DNA_ID=CAMNT_0022413753 /DNA_START=97 /DNA_END=546 /DNA_ORIENTATION=-